MKIIQIQVMPAFSQTDYDGETTYNNPCLLGLSDDGDVYELINKDWSLIIRSNE
jgi:hypothetical protein